MLWPSFRKHDGVRWALKLRKEKEKKRAMVTNSKSHKLINTQMWCATSGNPGPAPGKAEEVTSRTGIDAKNISSPTSFQVGLALKKSLLITNSMLERWWANMYPQPTYFMCSMFLTFRLFRKSSVIRETNPKPKTKQQPWILYLSTIVGINLFQLHLVPSHWPVARWCFGCSWNW